MGNQETFSQNRACLGWQEGFTKDRGKGTKATLADCISRDAAMTSPISVLFYQLTWLLLPSKIKEFYFLLL